MASGYIHISRKDVVFDNDNNVVYWKNGARYLGEIAKAVLNPGEETEVVKYYLKSAVTKKAILIDAGVIVGGGVDYYFVTDEANFINVRIETADFSSDGGGDGVTVTFLLPESKYYTVHYVEENGDIKLYDVDGDAGALVPDALPDVTDASAGDILALDANKETIWKTPGVTIRFYYYYRHQSSLDFGFLYPTSPGDDKFAAMKKITTLYGNFGTIYKNSKLYNITKIVGSSSTPQFSIYGVPSDTTSGSSSLIDTFSASQIDVYYYDY